MKSHTRNRIMRQESAPGRRPVDIKRRKSRLWIILVTLLAAGATWAVFEFVVWNRLPTELVGTWEVQGGPQDGAVFEFSRSGNMVAKINDGGNLGMIHSTIQVEGKKMVSTSKQPSTGAVHTSAMLIQKLTARELVIEDDQGKIWEMKRID